MGGGKLMPNGKKKQNEKMVVGHQYCHQNWHYESISHIEEASIMISLSIADIHFHKFTALNVSVIDCRILLESPCPPPSTTGTCLLTNKNIGCLGFQGFKFMSILRSIPTSLYRRISYLTLCYTTTMNI